MKLNGSNRGSGRGTPGTRGTDMTSRDPRGRKFYDCPTCSCRFLTESDLFYHLYTHVKPKKIRQVKARPSRKLTLKKYQEKMKAFRENYGGTGLYLTRKGTVKIQYSEDSRIARA